MICLCPSVAHQLTFDWVFVVQNAVHLRYAFQAMMINNWEDNDTIFLDGKTVLQYYGMDNEGSAWENIGILFAFYLVFISIAYLALAKLSHIKR